MKIVLLVFVVVYAAGCDGGSLESAAPSSNVQPAFKQIGDAREIMTAIVIPTSDALFAVGATPPVDEKAWTVLENSALMLAESGNLLMIGNRAVNEGSWMELSRALTDSGEAALKAARNKNVDEVLAAGDKIYAACDNCHKKYMDKSAK